MQHAQALILAEDALNALTRYCECICIAGSIRRQRPEVKDIEIVCIPRMVPTGLFEDELEVDPDFCATVRRWHKVKGEPTGKYTLRMLPDGMKLDVFIVDADTWGWQVCLRTGSKAFNQDVLIKAMHQQGYESDEGSLRRNGQMIATPEEVDVFRLFKLPGSNHGHEKYRGISSYTSLVKVRKIGGDHEISPRPDGAGHVDLIR
jgi:DNA polymerase/3'-5' exonuclease PolX